MALGHNPRISTNGLVLCLDAANPRSYPGFGTTWTDLSGNGSIGTLNNGVGFSNDNGGIMIFDGVDDFVTIPDSSLFSFTNNQFTFNYWVRFANLTSNNGIVGKGEGSWEYAIYPSSVSSLQFYSWPLSGNGPVYSNVFSTPTFVANQWYNHCWTANGGNSFLYINGNLISTNNKNPLYEMGNGSSRLTIGAAGDAGGLKYLNGNLGNMLIYNRFLSAQEIQQNFYASRGRYGV